MQQRRRISSPAPAGLIRSNPTIAVLVIVAVVVTAAFGGNQVIRNTADGFGEVLNETGSFDDGENVVVDDPAIALQGADEEVERTVKEFSRDEPFSMFALQWYGEPELAAFVRADRGDGTWSEWYEMPMLHGETTSGKVGTEPVWIEPTTRVQVNMSNVDIVGEPVTEQSQEPQQSEQPDQEQAPAENAPEEIASTPTEPEQEAPEAPAAPAAQEAATGAGAGLAPIASNYGDIAPVADTHDHSHEGHSHDHSHDHSSGGYWHGDHYHPEVEYTALGTAPAEEIDTIFIDGGYSGGAIDMTSNTPGMPDYIPRSTWGGDIVRDCNTSDAGPTKSVTIHHTAGSNNYSQAQSIDRIRGYWSYHANTNGWCDLGYNALVDKYGTIYEGRQGGLENNVQGAHVGGFNSNTWSISAMGNYETAQPTNALLQSIGELAGWRAAHSGFDPMGENSYVSGGFAGSKVPRGQSTTEPNINSHQHFHYTSCPGKLLYERLPTIRNIAKDHYDSINSGSIGTSTSPTTSTTGSTAPTESPTTPNAPEPAPNPNPGSAEGTPTALLSSAIDGDTGALLTIAGSLAVILLAAGAAQGMITGESTSLGDIEVHEGLTVSELAPIIDGAVSLSGDSEISNVWNSVYSVFGDVLGRSQGGVGQTTPTDTSLSSTAFALFENGIIVSNEQTGTNALWGAMADAWAGQGYDVGPLGMPTSSPAATGNGEELSVGFEGGSITYDPTTNQVHINTN